METLQDVDFLYWFNLVNGNFSREYLRIAILVDNPNLESI